MITRKTNLREAQAELNARKAKASTTTTTNTGLIIPHWNAPFNSTSVVRLLPDGDESNPLPFVTKFTIALPFAGMINSDNDTDQPVTVKVVSPVTFDKKCPITEAIKPYWRGGEDEKAVARTYYRKPTFIYAALAVSLPFAEENVPENPVRTLHLNRSIHDIVIAYLSNAEVETAPYDMEHGRDLRITKKQVGQWANYTGSTFSLKERALSEQELAGIEKFGLRDLSQDLGTAPTDAEITEMYEMYLASLAGEPFDNAKWGRKYRAYGAGLKNAPATASVSAANPATNTGELIAGLRVKAQVAA